MYAIQGNFHSLATVTHTVIAKTSVDSWKNRLGHPGKKRKMIIIDGRGRH
jgi:hypothetical protein